MGTVSLDVADGCSVLAALAASAVLADAEEAGEAGESELIDSAVKPFFFIDLRMSEVFFQIRMVSMVNSKPRRLRTSKNAPKISTTKIPVSAAIGL